MPPALDSLGIFIVLWMRLGQTEIITVVTRKVFYSAGACLMMLGWLCAVYRSAVLEMEKYCEVGPLYALAAGDGINLGNQL